MQNKGVFVALAAVILGVAGALIYFVTRPGEETKLDPAAGAHEAAEAGETPQTAPTDRSPRRKGAQAAVNAWKRVGDGSVVGIVHEYGTDKPVGGAAVNLVAEGGPQTTLNAVTAADGSFTFAKVANWNDWTLKVAGKAPFAELELGGIAVAANQQTNVGVVYLPPRFSVKGIVIDEFNQPIAGARVRALRNKVGESRANIVKFISEMGDEPVATDEGITNDKGAFELKKTPPGDYDFAISAPPFAARMESSVIVTPEAAERTLKFAMVRGFELEGKVVRKDGASPEGLTIVAFTNPESERTFINPTKIFATTDAGGSFKLVGLPAGRVMVSAVCPGRPLKMNENTKVPETRYIELVMAGDAILEGLVANEQGKPIEGAEITVVASKKGQSVAQAKTNAEGRFEIQGLDSGKAELFFVRADGYAPYPDDMDFTRGPGRTSLTLTGGRNTQTITLKRGATVRGKVVTKDGAKPIEGARVALMGPMSFFIGGGATTTGSDGAFEITGASKGMSMVAATKEGWTSGTNPGDMMRLMMMGGRGGEKAVPPDMIDIKDLGETYEITVEMSKATVIRGKVLDPSGKPIAGSRVQAVVGDDNMSRGMAFMAPGGFEARLTDSTGAFEVSGPAPGTAKVAITAKSDEWLDGRSDPFTTATDGVTKDIVVQMRAGGTIEGKVIGDGGEIIEGASVTWATSSDWWARTNAPATSGKDGVFRFTRVSPGEITVRASAKGYAQSNPEKVSVDEGKTATLTIALSRGKSISGRVIAQEGTPIPNARLRWRRLKANDEEDWSTEMPRGISTEADGSFEVTGLADGNYTITAEADGYANGEAAKTPAGSINVIITMPRALTIRGIVRCAGQPVEGVTVAAQADGAKSSNISNETTNQNGEFTLEKVPPGSYTLNVSVNWWRNEGKVANIREARVTGIIAGTDNVVINVEPGLAISGTVQLPDGSPAASGWVNATSAPTEEQRKSGKFEWTNRTAQIQGGKFEIVGLAPGDYDIDVNVEGAGHRRVRASADTRDLKVKLGAAGKIKGRVVDEQGRIVAECWVSAGGGGAMTDGNGNFEITGVEPGNCKVEAWFGSNEGRHGTVENVEVRANETTTIADVVVRPPAK